MQERHARVDLPAGLARLDCPRLQQPGGECAWRRRKHPLLALATREVARTEPAPHSAVVLPLADPVSYTHLRAHETSAHL
eukprot:9546694-Alexandrium_andersonii.AAC.1